MTKSILNVLKRLFAMLKRLLRAFFSFREEKPFPWLPVTWIAALVLSGAFLWGVFFNWGNVPFGFMDWGEVWAARMQAWRDALLNNTIPLHLHDVGAMRTENDRYFTIADMVSTPQVILLRWLQVGMYALVNNILLYGIATYFLLQIRKKFSLSLFVFSVMFLLFQFNGFIVTHLSVGHLSWGGYYLFPAFVLYLMELLEGKQGWRWVTKMALLLFFMFLQGSFHHLVWCFIVLGVLAVIRWKNFFNIAKAIVFTILLSMVRILPVFARMQNVIHELDFLDGYPLARYIIQSLIYNSTPDMGMPHKVYDSVLGYWEFDIFIGLAGLLFIALGILFLLTLHYQKREIPYLLVPAAVLTFLSIRDNFLKVLFYNPILTSSERATTRLMGLALVIMILLAAIYYQRLIEQFSANTLVQILQVAFLLIIARDLVLHTLRWSVVNAFNAFPQGERNLALVKVSNRADPVYIGLLAAGAVISAGTIFFLWWINRREKIAATPSSS